MTDATRASALVRSEMLEHLKPVTAAWTVNGRDLDFVTDFDTPIRAGTFVILTAPDGGRCFAQVHGLDAETRTGIRIDVDTSDFGMTSLVRSANVELMNRVVIGSGQIIGRLDGGDLRSFDNASIEPAEDAAVAEYFDGVIAGSGVEIGAIRGTEIAARLQAKGFARHTFMCGQSGSGKTFSLGVILERLLLSTDLPIVVVDPNSDYVNLGAVTSRRAINRFRSSPMSADEYAELAERYPDRAGVVVASARRGDLPLQIHLSDLTLDEQALTMQLDPVEHPAEFHALVAATTSLGDRTYGVEEVQAALGARFDEASRRLGQRIANLGIADWSVWAPVDEPSLAGVGTAGHRALVLDTGSLADTRERSVVSLALLGRLRRRPGRAPVQVVIDEAHNVCPPDAASELEQAVTDLALWIAGEGRKYGIYLLLSTQRPQKIHRNVLSQCDNLLLMRINSTGDLDELIDVFSHVPAPLIAEAKSHAMGEMLAAGPVAPTPLRLQVGVRWTKEGGADLPTSWTTPSS
jgi:DNA helicase HerA-like ATPase